MVLIKKKKIDEWRFFYKVLKHWNVYNRRTQP